MDLASKSMEPGIEVHGNELHGTHPAVLTMFRTVRTSDFLILGPPGP